jgi:hypothetical protein
LGLRSARARSEQTSRNAVGALRLACEASETSHRRKLSACEVWARVEVGLVLLATGDMAGTSEETGQSVALIPHLHLAWIRSEEVY